MEETLWEMRCVSRGVDIDGVAKDKEALLSGYGATPEKALEFLRDRRGDIKVSSLIPVARYTHSQWEAALKWNAKKKE